MNCLGYIPWFIVSKSLRIEMLYTGLVYYRYRKLSVPKEGYRYRKLS